MRDATAEEPQTMTANASRCSALAARSRGCGRPARAVGFLRTCLPQVLRRGPPRSPPPPPPPPDKKSPDTGTPRWRARANGRTVTGSTTSDEKARAPRLVAVRGTAKRPRAMRWTNMVQLTHQAQRIHVNF